MLMPMTAAETFPVGRESLAGDLDPTSVVSTPNSPRMAVAAATSGELLTEDQFRKEMHRKDRKNARRAAERREATLLQLEQYKKRETEATQSLTAGAVKVHAIGRCALMVNLIRSGGLQYANANPVEEARLAWELAGDLMARREGWQREEQPLVPEERASLAAREVERARQRQELQGYLERMEQTDVNDVL